MKSRYLAHLEARIAKARGQPEETELHLERVSCLARLGQVQDARELLSELRCRVLASPSLRASVLYHIAEGLCDYYTSLGGNAWDRFSRAKALALAASQVDLVARSSSWLALMQYGSHEFVPMLSSLNDAFDNHAAVEPETLARSCLLIAQTVHIANRFDDAIPWYRRARQYCAQTEDDLTLSALMHNMASIWASNARNAMLGGPATRDSSRKALSGALASLNFDEMVGVASLDVFAPLLRAQIESIEGNSLDASIIYAEQLDSLNIEAMKGWQVWLQCDYGWNLLREGKRSDAVRILQSAEKMLIPSLHPDDKAAALFRLSAAYEELGEPEKARVLEAESERSWKEFMGLQESLMQIISSSVSLKAMTIAKP